MLVVLARNWWIVALRGLAAILFGVLLVVNPRIGLAALILLFGAYALVDGIFSVVAAITRRGGEPRWVMLLVSGLLGILIGVVTVLMPGLTALALLYIIAGWAVVRGVLEIASAIRLRKVIRGEIWLGLAGALSVAFGVLLFAFPGAGALALILWIAVFAIALGVLLVGLALKLRRWSRSPEEGLAHPA